MNQTKESTSSIYPVLKFDVHVYKKDANLQEILSNFGVLRYWLSQEKTKNKLVNRRKNECFALSSGRTLQ